MIKIGGKKKEKKYAKAYTEGVEILKQIPKEEYEKIPETEIQFYENNCDKNYKYEYDENKTIKEQPISREANAVIISIYMNYFANEKQKGIINEILKQNSINAENEKKEKYDINNIFSKENNISSNNTDSQNNSENDSSVEDSSNENDKKDTSENLPVEINDKKENFIKKIINKIKKMFVKA